MKLVHHDFMAITRQHTVVLTILGSILVLTLAGIWQTRASGVSSSAQGIVRDEAGKPVANAEITLSGTGLSYTAVNRADGTFEITTIPLTNDYQIVTITVDASGYGRYTMRNAVLYTGEALILDSIQLSANDQSIDGGGLPMTLERPPANVLQIGLGGASSSNLPPRFFSNDTIPSTIRVAITGYASCGYYSNGQYILYPITQVQTLNFNDYVKGVLPHEWIASWNAASLRAGAMAVKMYGWFKINIGPRGVWNGQPYDVRADTCDQVYTGTTYASTNAAVDDMVNLMMRRNGQVVEIHYVDGIQATCAGTFPGKPCMEQWGSKSLGDQGWDWLSILHYYYDPVDITGNITGGYTTPDDGAVIGNSGYLAGIASADAGVREVRFMAQWGGVWHILGYDSSAPYEYHWDLCATGVPNGSVVLGFDVTDTSGNIALSPQGTRTITVNADCSQPRGGLTSPLDGATVGKTAALSAWAAANGGVQEVRFTASWAGKAPFVVYSDSVLPYSYTWDLCASDVPDGAITLGVEIMDHSGNVALSPTGTRTISKTYACPHTAAPARNVFDTHTPTLSWNRVVGAVSYQLEVAGNTVFNSLNYSNFAIPADTLFATTTPLENGTYYWRVRACSTATQCGTWSAMNSFVVDAP